MPRRRAMLLLAATIAALLAVDASLAWLWSDATQLAGRRLAPYVPPLFNDAQHASLERLRARAAGHDVVTGNVAFDAELGWAPVAGSRRAAYAYDARGARIDDAAEDDAATRPAITRVVLVGGSFTHGDEVPYRETWAAQLEARRADVDVVNLGVGAYGVDQAALRLAREARALLDAADVAIPGRGSAGPDGNGPAPSARREVWLGFMPSAALRVVTMYRPALRHHDPTIGVKPRFVLDDGGALRLVPCPARDEADVVALVTDPTAFLTAFGEHDFWVSRVPAAYAPRGSSWMHRSLLGRLLLARAEQRDRDASVWLRDRSSEVARVLDALVRRMRDDAAAAGAAFRVVVLPDGKALREAAAGNPSWATLVDGWRAAGLDVVDVTPSLIAARAHDRPEFWRPHGHYAAPAHRVVADALAGSL